MLVTLLTFAGWGFNILSLDTAWVSLEKLWLLSVVFSDLYDELELFYFIHRARLSVSLRLMLSNKFKTELLSEFSIWRILSYEFFDIYVFFSGSVLKPAKETERQMFHHIVNFRIWEYICKLSTFIFNYRTGSVRHDNVGAVL